METTTPSSITTRTETIRAEPELIEQYLPLVRKVVMSLARHLPPQVDVDDLHSVGTMGLIAAVRRFDSDQEKTFEAYAVMRIRGAVLDELRRLDSLPRTARAKARNLQETSARLEQSLGREPNDEELSIALGMNTRELRRMRNQVRPMNFISLDNRTNPSGEQEADMHEAIADENQETGSDHCQQNELIEILRDKIDELSERQRKILSMIYFENMRLSEIAEVFEVTEARVCQIRSQAIANLRKQMQNYITE
ncbi:MAG: FliA/WhiG family RNA polymerase sigma factor [Opitutales bacterium]|nr:FliA/WhiG family RNA polymerase sigma factor [Opitutales bacterium]